MPPINVSWWGRYRYSSVRREFILVAYYFQLSSSNFKSTGFDWAVGRRDLQGFNIASTSSFCGLDILQLQFHHSVWIPVAQCVHTMAFDTIAGCHRCARPSWSNLSIWQVATSKKNMSTRMGPVKHKLGLREYFTRVPFYFTKKGRFCPGAPNLLSEDVWDPKTNY